MVVWFYTRMIICQWVYVIYIWVGKWMGEVDG